ncbi:MAG: DUF2530 domain-containing protein [Dactylosporangium sp.]|nr:DUF2530 domain-containing protein [Dactylosporangium sp.]NNJ59540.1 DUF2530 domain-containing protein [Dactylosporangium sp.]
MIIWALLGLLTLASRDWLADHGHGSWPWICLAGFLLGLPGLAVMRRHDAGRLRRAANRRQSIRPLRRDPRDAP